MCLSCGCICFVLLEGGHVLCVCCCGVFVSGRLCWVCVLRARCYDVFAVMLFVLRACDVRAGVFVCFIVDCSGVDVRC